MSHKNPSDVTDALLTIGETTGLSVQDDLVSKEKAERSAKSSRHTQRRKHRYRIKGSMGHRGRDQ